MSETGTILSLNVGLPKKVDGVLTAIFKMPVAGKIALRRLNLEGDRQADLTVHGGPHKAVYGYPSEHYTFWRKQLPDMDLPHGIFGENLTTTGWDEEEMFIGDRFRAGTAVLQVAQPRMPCYKLGIRFGRADMVKKFWLAGLAGFYFSVVQEGEMAAGEGFERTERAQASVSVADVVRLYRGDEKDEEKRRRALAAPLFGGWKDGIRERMT